MNAHVRDTPTPVSEFRDDAPGAMISLLNRLLAKNPADRFPTPADAADALGRFAVDCDLPALAAQWKADRTVPACRTASSARSGDGTARRRPRRKRWIACAAASVSGRRGRRAGWRWWPLVKETRRCCSPASSEAERQLPPTRP